MTAEEILGSHMDVIGPLLESMAGQPGDIVEFGVYAGATTVQLAQFGRKVWAFDTFSGIPKESYTEGLDVDAPGKFVPTYQRIGELAEIPNVHIVSGRFEDTLPNMEIPVRLAYLDCDLYESANCALEWLGAHLMIGTSYIVVDDYETHPGIRKAVSGFLAWYRGRAKFDGNLVIRFDGGRFA